jgi:hypothetical protein
VAEGGGQRFDGAKQNREKWRKKAGKHLNVRKKWRLKANQTKLATKRGGGGCRRV